MPASACAAISGLSRYFADNLTDEQGILNAYNTPFADFVVRNKPRTIGMRAHLDF